MSINSRKKGTAYELAVIRRFREKGWGTCVSSRSESKRKDDAGIDICYTDPFQVQCKAVEKLPPPHDTLAKMPKGKNVIFHKRNNKGTLVYMSEDLFWELVEKAGMLPPLDNCDEVV
jgi:hypothetical protein